jgi:hypothetical protein
MTTLGPARARPSASHWPLPGSRGYPAFHGWRSPWWACCARRTLRYWLALGAAVVAAAAVTLPVFLPHQAARAAVGAAAHANVYEALVVDRRRVRVASRGEWCGPHDRPG